jgi:hypothetical protein
MSFQAEKYQRGIMRATRKTIEIALVILILLSACSSSKAEMINQVTVAPGLTGEIDIDEPFSEAAGYIEGAKMFDAQEALKHIEYLASDELEGRLTGTPGNKQAGDYIASRFAEYGLQPAGMNNSYFQPFNTTVTVNVEQPLLTITHPNADDSSDGELSHTYVTHTDYVPRITGYVGSGDVTGRVVLLGKCNPYKLDLTMSDLVVLCKPSTNQSNDQLLEKALEYKIGGLLIIREDDGPYARSGYAVGELIKLPAFGISRSVAEDLLKGSRFSFEDLDQLGNPETLTTTVHMAVVFERSTTKARNVLGLLPGTDPQHRDEIVVISAHYDHVGYDPNGMIFNGANDNASGVAIVLEVARLWQAQGYQPARSVLFAAWDAEEQGYRGARFYVSNPPFSTDQTIAMINLEMSGIGDKVFVAGHGPLADQLKESAILFGYTPEYESASGSDDIVFHDAGIPSGIYSTDPETYYELLLHRPEDDPQMMHLDSLRTIGILSAHALAAWVGGGPTLIPE